MPKAFTFIAQRVSISIFNDTITVYDKTKYTKAIRKNPSSSAFFAISLIDDFHPDVDAFLDSCMKLSKFRRYVHQDDRGHSRCHQDTFDRKALHSHIKFNSILTFNDIENLCQLLSTHNVLTNEESEALLRAFRAANEIPPESPTCRENVSQLTIDGLSAEPPKKRFKRDPKDIKKEDDYCGFKPGFLH